MTNALLPRSRSMAETWGDIFGARKVYHQIVAEIWDDGFQAHDYSYDHQSQEVEELRLKSHGSYLISSVGGFTNVSSKY